MAEVVDSKRFVIQSYEKENPIGLYQSTIAGDDCYTLTYLVPSQTNIRKIDLLPLEMGTLIATASAKLIEVEGDKANLIVQLQKRPLDNSDPAKPDYEKCPVINPKSTDFGEYQSFTNITIN